MGNVDQSYTPRKPKQKYTREEKEALCKEWKASGMKRKQFCETKGILLTTFYSWGKQLWPAKKKREVANILPAVAKGDTPSTLGQLTCVEVCLSNRAVVRLTLTTNKVIPFIEELSHAVTIIR